MFLCNLFYGFYEIVLTRKVSFVEWEIICSTKQKYGFLLFIFI